MLCSVGAEGGATASRPAEDARSVGRSCHRAGCNELTQQRREGRRRTQELRTRLEKGGEQLMIMRKAAGGAQWSGETEEEEEGPVPTSFLLLLFGPI